MAVRRLQEERGLSCKEMKQHWTVLTQKMSKFEALINEISSKSLYFFLMCPFAFQLFFQHCLTLQTQ
ncbi:hypothetical protein PO909_000026 [Leuciscus waleckii]